MLDEKAPTGDADAFKYLCWREELEAPRRSPGLGFCDGGGKRWMRISRLG
jgi:hypothetical protein